MALKVAGPGAVGDVMRHLIRDVNLRIRLIAASCLLPADPGNAEAGAVLMEALGHPALRVRKAALELVESLAAGGAAFLGGLNKRDGLEEEPELRDALARLIERLAPPVGTNPEPVTGQDPNLLLTPMSKPHVSSFRGTEAARPG